MNKNYLYILVTVFVLSFGVIAIMLIVENENNRILRVDNDSKDVISMNDSADNTVDDPEQDNGSDDIKGEEYVDNGSKYQEFSVSKLIANKDKKQILFYHASWCPTCKILNDNLNSNLVSIPSDVVIYRVDYDDTQYNQMKRDHGITYQHTLVYVNENGELIDKWAGSLNVDEVIDKLNNV